MKRTFTPGPWHALAGNATYGVFNNCGQRVATVGTWMDEEARTAKLIAAAPCLLDALCAAVNSTERDEWITKANNAIAKAT